MRQEANASQDLYMRVREKAEEAGLAAGVHESNISIVDRSTPAGEACGAGPAALSCCHVLRGAMGGFGGAALVREQSQKAVAGASVLLFILLMGGAGLQAQAPTPSTSGLPTGVASFPQTQENEKPARPQGSAGGVEWWRRFGESARRISACCGAGEPRLCRRLLLQAIFSKSASTTRRNSDPRCMFLLREPLRCP